jgi:hypothetical protein
MGEMITIEVEIMDEMVTVDEIILDQDQFEEDD